MPEPNDVRHTRKTGESVAGEEAQGTVTLEWLETTTTVHSNGWHLPRVTPSLPLPTPPNPLPTPY